MLGQPLEAALDIHNMSHMLKGMPVISTQHCNVHNQFNNTLTIITLVAVHVYTLRPILY